MSYSLRNNIMSNVVVKSDKEKFVENVSNGNNVEAKQLLKKMIKNKIINRVKQVLEEQ